MAFISGKYDATFNNVSIGQIEDGFEIEHSIAQEDIIGQDMGDSVQDGVYRGGNMFISCTLMEFSTSSAMLALWWMHSAVLGRMGKIGTLIQANFAQALVLTALAGTPAASGGNVSTLTAAKVALAPNFDVRLLFAPRLRRVPLRLRLYPYSDGANNTLWFSTT